MIEFDAPCESIATLGLRGALGSGDARRIWQDGLTGARERLRGSRLLMSDYDGVSQFAGNGTAAYPPLYNRNLIGFFPFQVTAHKWVIPTYVMTQDTVTLTLQDH